MNYLYIFETDTDHALARRLGEVDGQGYQKYLVEYIDEDGFDTGRVELFYSTEKYEIALFETLAELKKFANKMKLLKK